MTSDERRDPRQPVSLEIRFKSATLTDFVERYSRDISHGGMFVKTQSPMPSGTLIKFDLRLQDQESIIQGVGRVVWRRLEDANDESPAGMGIKFIKLNPVSKENLAAIISGKSVGKGDSGEAPVVEERQAQPAKQPQRIAPVRPQGTPKAAKKTMRGIGSTPPGASGRESTPPKSDPSGSPWEEKTVVGGPSLEALNEALNEGPKSDPPRETDILADISSAIDTALGDKVENSSAAETEDDDLWPREKSEATALKPPKDEFKDSGRIKVKTPPGSEPLDTEAERVGARNSYLSTPTAQAVISTRAGVAPERRGIPKTIWILLGITIAAVLVYYFGIRTPALDASATEKIASTSPPQTNSAEQEARHAESAPSAMTKAVETERQPAESRTTVNIKTTPAGAQIFVNGERQQGTTPLQLNSLVAGKEVEIEARLFPYISQKEKIVPSEQPMDLDLTLPPAKVKLSFKSTPTGVQVLIDGKWVGKTPLMLAKIDAGPAATYTLRRYGYDEFAGQIQESDWTLVDGVYTANIDVALKKPEPEAKPENQDIAKESQTGEAARAKKRPVIKVKKEDTQLNAAKGATVAPLPGVAPAVAPAAGEAEKKPPKAEPPKPKEPAPEPPAKPAIEENPF